jgi:hypothetical protein
MSATRMSSSGDSSVDGWRQVRGSEGKAVARTFTHRIALLFVSWTANAGDLLPVRLLAAHVGLLRTHWPLRSEYAHRKADFLPNRFALSLFSSVKFVERKVGFAHFLVQVCAIVGGVFTVLGLVNGVALAAGKRFKANLNKLG